MAEEQNNEINALVNGAPDEDELETIRTELEQEQKAREELGKTLADRDRRIVELESSLKDITGEKESLKQANENSTAELAELKQVYDGAVARYREALAAAHPEIPPALIDGNSIDELFDSAEKGKAVVASVRKNIEAGIATGRVPAGAPVEGSASYQQLSPREKIAAGIKQQGGIS